MDPAPPRSPGAPARPSSTRAARLLRTAAVGTAAVVGITALVVSGPGSTTTASAGSVVIDPRDWTGGAPARTGVVGPQPTTSSVAEAAATGAPVVTDDLPPRPVPPASRSTRRRAPVIVRDGRSVADWRIGDGGMLWPVPGEKTTATAGPRVHPVYGYASCHTGVDIAGTWGTPILAAQAGVVSLVDKGGAFGRHTVVKHAGSLSTMYAHQEEVLVRVGERVSRGQVIGTIGSSGWVTGPHLHFEVHKAGMPFDPLAWFLATHRERAVSCAHRMPY